MKRATGALAAGLVLGIAQAQVADSSAVSRSDTSGLRQLESVVVLPDTDGRHEAGQKALGSLDSYLAGNDAVDMVRRGAYAWEPLLNGMASERSIITVDGMRIYGACTDKMDPITSYVETSNLARARISNGVAGGQHGGTIAGGIDLERRRSVFTEKRTAEASASMGFESNNSQRILGASASFSGPKLRADLGATMRQAENYRAGHRNGLPAEVLHSAFNKVNLSTNLGYRPAPGKELEASLIFDKATDVGYPGLPMDVSLAQAVIAAVQYRRLPEAGPISLWETKVYYNTITHVMDDSQRPVVPMRMDMPGWSSTAGFYSKAYANVGKHRLRFTWSGHRNNSLAEMTMYPNDPAEPTMFMLTWPDINTLYTGLHGEDRLRLGVHSELTLRAGMGVHGNEVASLPGLRSLQLFHSNMQATRWRLLPSAGVSLGRHQGRFMHRIGAGYSERAPSVSEGYGYYLLNANDNYDYVGDPNMANERSWMVELGTTYSYGHLKLEVSGTWFRILDYIVGERRPDLLPMNITAAGVKVYGQLPHADVVNTALAASYRLAPRWVAGLDGSWRHGAAQNGSLLPLMQPLQVKGSVEYKVEGFSAMTHVLGSTANNPAFAYGETSKTGWTTCGASLSKELKWQKHGLTLNAGVDNLLDQWYTTFSDWAGIPAMGRNIYCHAVFTL
jgi:iron complex outermembrane receptor protein